MGQERGKLTSKQRGTRADPGILKGGGGGGGGGVG